MPNHEQQKRFEEALTDGVYRKAWLFATRFCATREDAQDLLQESLAHAFLKFGQLEDVSKFKPWLFSIIRSRYLNQRRRNAVKLSDSYWNEAVSAQECESGLSEQIVEAFGLLTAEQNELLRLFYLDGLSMKEVGMVLGIPGSAVGQRLLRARRALRKHLGNRHTLEVQLQG